MRRFLLSIAGTVAIASTLSGCASVWTSTDYTPYVGDETVYIGKGGAMEVMDGIEVWKQGLPAKKYKIVGLINAEIADGFGAENWMIEAAAAEAKEHGADAIIKQSSQRIAGTPYINSTANNISINQSNTYNGGSNYGASATAMGNSAVVNAAPSGFAGGFAQGVSQGASLAMAISRLQGQYLAIQYVK